MVRILGFGTGCHYKNLEPVSNEAVELIKLSGCNGIELCAIKSERIDYLKNISVEALKSFQYVSLHAPDIIYKDNSETHDILDKIQEEYNRLNFKVVVFCPNFVQDWQVFDKYHFPIAFENMDKRKNFGTSIKDMKFVLENKKKGMVLDLTHIYTIDKSMDLANKFYNTFKHKIMEVHLSGYKIHGFDEQQHYPIYISQNKSIINQMPKNIPTIIESVWPEIKKVNLKENIVNELKKELEYINKSVIN